MLIDSRKHIENIRRCTDGGFRYRDDVWGDVEEDDVVNDDDDKELVENIQNNEDGRNLVHESTENALNTRMRINIGMGVKYDIIDEVNDRRRLKLL